MGTTFFFRGRSLMQATIVFLCMVSSDEEEHGTFFFFSGFLLSNLHFSYC